MKLSSYSSLGFVNVIRMTFGRTIERHARWLLDFGRHLAIEIHGPPLTARIHDLLRRRGFAVYQTGETTYGENRRFSGDQAIGASS